MEGQEHISALAGILLFIIGGALFIILGLFSSSLLRPNRPNEEKQTNYECGEDPIGHTKGNFNPRFYVIALIFILFEVEIAFLFPWATVFGNKELIAATDGLWGWFSLVEVFIFIAILLLGFIYVWAKGYLDWIRPTILLPDFKGNVPAQRYELFNQQQVKKEKA